MSETDAPPDDEQWRDIPGFPRYQASDQGRIRSLKRQQVAMMNPRLIRGYLRVQLRIDGRRKEVAVHHLVLLAFVGPRPSRWHQCRHGVAGALVNRLDNLCWGIAWENVADTVRDGTAHWLRHRGEDSNRAVFTDRECAAMRALDAMGIPRAVIARAFGASEGHVGRIADGKSRAVAASA